MSNTSSRHSSAQLTMYLEPQNEAEKQGDAFVSSLTPDQQAFPIAKYGSKSASSQRISRSRDIVETTR